MCYNLIRPLHVFQTLACIATGRMRRALTQRLCCAQGTVPALQLAVAGALLAGCGIASTTLWYYSRRYVGEVSVRRDRPGRVTVSVLDFWGNREVS